MILEIYFSPSNLSKKVKKKVFFFPLLLKTVNFSDLYKIEEKNNRREGNRKKKGGAEGGKSGSKKIWKTKFALEIGSIHLMAIEFFLFLFFPPSFSKTDFLLEVFKNYF